MWYIVPMEKKDRLTENIRVRISKEWKSHLEVLAEQRGPGTKLSDLAREAIHKIYFASYPITALRAAEAPKKSRSR